MYYLSVWYVIMNKLVTLFVCLLCIFEKHVNKNFLPICNQFIKKAIVSSIFCIGMTSFYSNLNQLLLIINNQLQKFT